MTEIYKELNKHFMTHIMYIEMENVMRKKEKKKREKNAKNATTNASNCVVSCSRQS